MDALKQAVQAHAGRFANRDGIALTPVPGLVVKCVGAPSGDLRAVCRPMAILVLQGAKRMAAGQQEHIFRAGQCAIVGADMPVAARVLEACAEQPYLALAIELEMAVLREVAAQSGMASIHRSPMHGRLFADDIDGMVLDCALRLMRLIDRPDAIPLLRPGIARELHYWLLSGRHGHALRTLADPGSHSSRLGAAIAVLRAEYRARIPVERLASASAMSLTAFHKHFKQMTSLTPGQYQKRLRLIEARRLMLEEGSAASSAAFDVGYESVSQFTREYRRLFEAPPKRDARRARSGLTDETGQAKSPRRSSHPGARQNE
jgi:AraC-like DNA-binding protein